MAPSAQLKVFPLERPAASWRSLVDAIEQMSSARDLYEIIESVKLTAREISGADGITFVLRDGDLSYYFEEDAIAPLWKGRRFPMSACISGWCMLRNTTAVISDIYADPRIPHDAYRPTFVKSLIMTPVGGEQPFAAIGAYWAEMQAFDEGELELLEALARSAATAIKAVQANNALKDLEQRLSILFEAGKFGAWELNCATGEFIASTTCRESLGRKAGEYFGYDDFVDAVHPEDRADFLSAFNTSLAECSKLATECRVEHPDGTVRWLSYTGRVTLDANGQPARFAGVTRDITELRRATGRLARTAATA